MLAKLRDIAIIAFLGGCTFAAVELGLTLQNARKVTLPAIQTAFTTTAGAFTATQTDIHALVLPTQKAEATWAAAGLTAAQTLAKERDAFAAQEASYVTLTQQGTLVLSNANLAVGDLRSAIQPLGPTIASLGTIAPAAIADLNDPNLKEGLANLNIATQNTAAATAHANSILASGDKIATHYEKVIDAPVAVWKQITGFFDWAAGRFY